jgi:D-arabinose 1-dehydrogenase-like Zn-dependent alcohol dehydrogenase
MRALRFHGNKDIRVDEIPEPPLKPGWVKVKNAWAGICGSGISSHSPLSLCSYAQEQNNQISKPH